MERRTVTLMHIRQCPRCELRFTSSSELDDHLINDHRPRQSPGNSAIEFSPQPAAALQGPAPDPPADDPAAWPRFRGRTWIVVLVGLLLIVLTGWLATTPTALIISGLIVLVAGSYLWRTSVGPRSAGHG
jgi:hypothetical protein